MYIYYSQSSQGGVITSGGGFSNHYSRPYWQDSAVSGYFAALGSNQPGAGYNAGGRGYPDVSLLGVAYDVIVGGSVSSTYGTSCSAPVFAAMGKCACLSIPRLALLLIIHILLPTFC